MEHKNHPQKTVLVVDDEPGIVMLVSTILRDRGYNVLTAISGREALNLSAAFTGDIHLVVSDFMMPPGITGLELATRMSTQRPDLKVLLVSGLTHARPLALSNGWDYLAKPFRLHELLASIDDLI